MILPPIQQALLLLLRQGLWNRQEDGSALFPLDDLQWNEIYHQAKKQTVQGIVFDGINLLPADCMPPRSLLLRWMVEVDSFERMNRHHKAILNGLQQTYAQSPVIPFVLLKGLNVADFYPHPGHRLLGDIDLWFGNEEQTEESILRMEALGLPVHRGGKGESSCVINGVLIEHHSYLIDLHSPLLRKEIRRWEAEVFAQSEGTLPPIANQLLLSTHILKHLINEGIGLRQLCDVVMTFNALHQEIDGAELERISHQWHILRWNRLLYALLVKYLGMPVEQLPFNTNTCPDKLMQEVMASGNFGQGDERYGERPEGTWANKQYTLKRIFHKIHLSLGYAGGETFWWLTELAGARLKELIKGKGT